jgi:hypothetical protein
MLFQIHFLGPQYLGCGGDTLPCPTDVFPEAISSQSTLWSIESNLED